MRQIYLLFCCLVWHVSTAQAIAAPSIQVPSTMWLADIKLRITPTAKARIQKMVDHLAKNEAAFQRLLDRANLFNPIIERILKEEGLPKDFKYLVIQESDLISDAVSSANAVGFWQFLDFTAREVGLKINSHVDERMNITLATRGAAHYLKKINDRYFNNWLYATLAYFMGKGNVRKKYDYKKYEGVKQMRIDAKTHWYVIHFLAHKTVFEKAMGKDQHPELHLHECHEIHGKTLGEIAEEFGVDKQKLRHYNKWMKRHKVPHDTTCVAIIPMTHQQASKIKKFSLAHIRGRAKYDYKQYWKRAAEFPKIDESNNGYTRVNALRGVCAKKGDTLEKLAQAGGISLEEFLRINDLSSQQEVTHGQVYYYNAKSSWAAIHFHIVLAGETWWSIAQKYGMKKEQLLRKNRLRQEVKLRPGRVLWLRFIRPAKIPVAYEYQ